MNKNKDIFYMFDHFDLHTYRWGMNSSIALLLSYNKAKLLGSTIDKLWVYLQIFLLIQLVHLYVELIGLLLLMIR